MADNTEQLETTDEEATEKDEPDYKALYEQAQEEIGKWKSFSRKNESRAKNNEGAATQLADLTKRLEALEGENTTLKAEAERKQLVAKVAKGTGVPESIVSMLSAEDEKALTAAAKAIADAYKTPGGAPRVPEGGKFSRSESGTDDRREFIRQLLGKE